jgi:hypothetical protein
MASYCTRIEIFRIKIVKCPIRSVSYIEIHLKTNILTDRLLETRDLSEEKRIILWKVTLCHEGTVDTTNRELH